MTLADVEAFVSSLDDVQRDEAFGYTLFFVGDDHRLPFVTLADSDNDWDDVSDLDRDGVFRVNVGVSRATFDALLDEADPAAVDHRVLDRFLPHPDYAKQRFVCILNPGPQNAEVLREVIAEAHAIASARLDRRTKR